jgi:hypothetical protein
MQRITGDLVRPPSSEKQFPRPGLPRSRLGSHSRTTGNPEVEARRARLAGRQFLEDLIFMGPESGNIVPGVSLRCSPTGTLGTGHPIRGTHKKMNGSFEQEIIELTRLKHHSHGLKKSTLWLTHSTWKRVFLSPQRSSLLIVVSRTKRTSEIELKSLSCSSLPRQKKRFRVSPSPHSLNEPKSLYHGPSGTFGFDSTSNSQLIEILQTDHAVMLGHAYALPSGHEAPQVDATRFRSVALFTEHEAP